MGEKTGQCFCGAVKFTATPKSGDVGVCHCSMCQRFSAGPFFEVDCGETLKFENEENLGVYNSSEWAERGFCSQCGSHLFYRLKQSNQYIMPAGLFDDDSQFTFDHQVFVDEKPSYYSFANDTKDMTGAEVFAKYAPPED